MTIEWKKTAQQVEKPVNGFVSVLICLLCLMGSGMLAVKLTNPDQGRLVTSADMEIRIQREVQRIQNDPRMPERAKSIALGLLNQGRQQGEVLRSRK